MPTKVCQHGNLARTCEVCELQAEVKALRFEAQFYRDRLQQLADRKRRTQEQRLAASALSFFDAMRREAEKRKP